MNCSRHLTGRRKAFKTRCKPTNPRWYPFSLNSTLWRHLKNVKVEHRLLPSIGRVHGLCSTSSEVHTQPEMQFHMFEKYFIFLWFELDFLPLAAQISISSTFHTFELSISDNKNAFHSTFHVWAATKHQKFHLRPSICVSSYNNNCGIVNINGA